MQQVECYLFCSTTTSRFNNLGKVLTGHIVKLDRIGLDWIVKYGLDLESVGLV